MQGRVKGQHEVGVCMCSNRISSFCNCVLSMHGEWVLAIISLPGILLSGTGHLHPERDSEHLEDLIVRFQPYLQISNFTAKEEFGDSVRGLQVQVEPFLWAWQLRAKRINHAVTLLNRESVNRDNGISLSYDIMKTDLIFFRGNVGNSLGHAVSLRWSHRSSFSKSSVDNNPRDAQSTELLVLQHASHVNLGEMNSVTYYTLFPTKVLNWHGLPTSQLNTIVLSVQANI